MAMGDEEEGNQDELTLGLLMETQMQQVTAYTVFSSKFKQELFSHSILRVDSKRLVWFNEI